jgi:PilZ domain-containing protein
LPNLCFSPRRRCVELAGFFAGAWIADWGTVVDDFDEIERRGASVEGGERRRYTRYAVDAWAEVLLKDGTMLFRGRLLDVSLGGCYIETEARLRLAPGSGVEMVFRVGDKVLRCDGVSRMVRERGAGFLFASMNARTRDELDGLIRELEASWQVLKN